ncbi:MAG: hypothetical protein M3Z35_06620 [Nitrospirota bacterium]|nr:hypothetical protein [Nitrospirota bacterium]
MLKMIRVGLAVGSITVCCALSTNTLAAPLGPAKDEPVFGHATIDIDQATLVTNGYTLRRILEAGEYFFSTPFTPFRPVKDAEPGSKPEGDGFGEGDVVGAPRYDQRHYFNRATPSFQEYRFLRVNGLGSQSCAECHSAIGTYHMPGTKTHGTQVRKPGANAGVGSGISNAFINPDFPPAGEKLPTQIIRNTPHVFGDGYIQTLAKEMTRELMKQRRQARAAAKSTPTTPVSVTLTTHGIPFGQFTTTYTSNTRRILGTHNIKDPF